MLSSPTTTCTAPCPGSLRRVHHIALNVHDLQASRHFYGAILGLHELTGEVAKNAAIAGSGGESDQLPHPDGTVLICFGSLCCHRQT